MLLWLKNEVRLDLLTKDITEECIQEIIEYYDLFIQCWNPDGSMYTSRELQTVLENRQETHTRQAL